MGKIVDDTTTIALNTLSEGGVALLSALEIPISPFSITLIKSIVTVVTKIGLIDVCADLQNRQLSSMQKKKVDIVIKTAIKTYYDLAQQNHWEENHPEAAQYNQFAIEFAEDIIIKALNESREQKQRFLGSFLGNTMYALNLTAPNWDNLFYCSTLITKLSLRQLNLINLINTNFDSCKSTKNEILCITDKVTISEMKELANSNIWVEAFSYQPNPTFLAIPLPFIKSTDFTRQICNDIRFPAIEGTGLNSFKDCLTIKPIEESGLPQSFISMLNIYLSKN